ncbi:cytochrome P450 [Rhodococcus sp. NPDC059968]|uniref:cytochrome P450 n=1 Tax=Rhodococcus sp. NPDC059968 TaxID=3347017 RepID=UPI00366B52CE
MSGTLSGAEPITLPIDRGMFDPPEELGRLRERTPLCRLRYPDGHVGWLVTSYELARQVLGDGRFSLFPWRPAVGDPEQENAVSVDVARRRDPRLAEVIDRYENCGKAAYEALSDPEVLDVLRSDPPPTGAHLSSDPPYHDWLRRKLAGWFTPRRVNQQRELVEQIVARQLAAMEQEGPALDLVETFCLPIPSQLICALLGASPTERHRFEQPTIVAFDPEATAQQKVAARHEFEDFLRKLIRRKRANPDDDLLSELVQDDELSDDVLVHLARFLFTAGHETTANMLALSVMVLLQDRTRWDALRADPAMVGAAVEELLRFHTLLHQQAFPRTALQDVVLAGHTIRAGETVAVSLAAANRDPDRFAEPDRLDLARKDAAGHLGLGYGIHQCLGQHYARLELQIGLTALASRFPELRLAVPIDEVPLYRPETFVHGVHRLPVTW